MRSIDVLMIIMVLVLLAYRAILAEPRIKTTAPEDYTGAVGRGDYMAADNMNQYAVPMGKQALNTMIQAFLYVIRVLLIWV